MVIDMNESRLETIEQIREFLTGTTDVAFAIPTEEAKRRAFVATLLKRFRYFSLRCVSSRGMYVSVMPVPS